MNFESAVIVAYGRSGSTLLQGVFNSIPGVLMRGENNDFARDVFHSYSRLVEAIGYEFTQNAHRTTDAWYGIQEIDVAEYLHNCRTLVHNAIVPIRMRGIIQCYGFKEIRYLNSIEELESYLEFLNQIMPRLLVVFNFRLDDAVLRSGIASGLWCERDRDTISSHIRAFETASVAYQQLHPDRSFVINYEDVVTNSSKIKALFEFMGVEYSEVKIREVLQQVHSTQTTPAIKAERKSGQSSILDMSQPGESIRLPSCFDESVEDIRFVKAEANPHIYCIVKGRRRHVPYFGWWTDEGWPTPCPPDTVDLSYLQGIPLGPTCPETVLIRSKSVNQIVHDPHLMRLYLGTLATGSGIEWRTKKHPFQLSLSAEVRYVEEFPDSNEGTTFGAGGTGLGENVQIDIIDKIENMASFDDDSLDFVLAPNVIEHGRNPIAALVSVHRSLREGGKLILTVSNKPPASAQQREITSVPQMVKDYENYMRERDLGHYERPDSLAVGVDAASDLDCQVRANLGCYCFTNTSFLELVSAISTYVTWREVNVFTAPSDEFQLPDEFYAILSK